MNKLTHTLNLTRFEICIYFAVYLIYLIYGFWAIASARSNILQTAVSDNFSPAWWSWLATQRDNSNDELQNFNNYIQQWWPWYIVHAGNSIFCKLFKLREKGLQHICQAILCGLTLICTLQPLSTLSLAVLLISFYLLAQLRSKLLIWLLTAACMCFVHVVKNADYWFFTLGYTEYFTFILIVSWSILRCCSFALHCAAVPEQNSLYTFDHFIGYTLYFPTLIYGPFLSFPRYATLFTNVHKDNNNSLVQQIFSLLLALLRTMLWWTLLHILLHFLYVHYMALDSQAVLAVGSAFRQHAVGYYMGQMFFLYYVITYGVGIAFARFDELQPPKRPRCIGRIHFYSNMWKFFDEGLYEFLYVHIYSELRGAQQSVCARLCATAATFAFVYVWHGCYSYVLIWSMLNFLCLVLEKCFKVFVASHMYQGYVEKHLTTMQAQRLRALLASQLFIPAAFSNIYFISGQAVGTLLMRGAYCSGFYNYLALTICSYCFFQCSELITSRINL